jgi:hypothetical protein
MSKAAVFRRGLQLPDSDGQEVVTQLNKGGQYWVLSSPTMGVATGSATFSITKFSVAGTNRVYQLATTTTVAGFTGITVATGAYAVVGAYVTTSGTHVVVAGTTGASIGLATMPVIPSTAFCYGLILLAASGTSAFTGGTTELDGTNANATFFNLTGSAPFAMSTAPITVVPG